MRRISSLLLLVAPTAAAIDVGVAGMGDGAAGCVVGADAAVDALAVLGVVEVETRDGDSGAER